MYIYIINVYDFLRNLKENRKFKKPYFCWYNKKLLYVPYAT